MNSKVETLYAEILSEMLVDCESRHTYKCYANCRENAEELLDKFMREIQRSVIPYDF